MTDTTFLTPHGWDSHLVRRTANRCLPTVDMTATRSNERESNGGETAVTFPFF